MDSVFSVTENFWLKSFQYSVCRKRFALARVWIHRFANSTGGGLPYKVAHKRWIRPLVRDIFFKRNLYLKDSNNMKNILLYCYCLYIEGRSFKDNNVRAFSPNMFRIPLSDKGRAATASAFFPISTLGQSVPKINLWDSLSISPKY